MVTFTFPSVSVGFSCSDSRNRTVVLFLSTSVRGDWTPLLVLVEQCGYTLERRHADVFITAPLVTCGVTVKVRDAGVKLLNEKRLHQ